MHVIPRPLSTTRLEGTVNVSSGWVLQVSARSLEPLAARFCDDVERDLAIRLAVVEVGEPRVDGHVIRIDVSSDVQLPGNPPTGLDPTGEDVDEWYRLKVADEGVFLAARTVDGARRGLATLVQLLAAGRRDGDNVVLDALEVVDGPRFSWRGLSLDVARCFFDVAELQRVIDMLHLYKMNVLHLHLSDDAGWRLEIPGRPKLTEIGGAGALGVRPGGYYTQAEFRDLVRYASDRGVTVVPEIDMPGHSAAAIRSYPQLSVRSADENSWMPVNVLEPETDGVLEFAREIVRALADVAPGPYIHVGGDEAFGMDPTSYSRFIDAVREMVTSAGKRMIVWQEGARSDVQPGDVVQHWLAFDESLESMFDDGRLEEMDLPEGMSIPKEMIPVIIELFQTGRADLGRAMERGAKVILSPAAKLYLDKPYAEDPVDTGQVAMQQRVGLRVYPPTTIEQSFEWDPAAALNGGLDAVAGIEAAMWVETVSSAEELEFMLLPRLVAIAEKAWAAEPLSQWHEFRSRLARQSTIWRRRGWNYFTSSLVDWR